MSAEPDCERPLPAGGPGVTRFATRGDHRLSYESSGAADGIPVLALHDLLADRGQFRALGEALPAGRYRVTLPDARGHGASPMISGRGYPASDLVADTLAVLDAEVVAMVHLVAAGWGAGIALRLAMTAPERVAALLLVEPYIPVLLAVPVDGASREESLRLLEVVQEAAIAAEKGQLDRALDLFLGARRGVNWREGLPKSRLGAIRRAASNLAPLLTGMSTEPFDRESLARVETPVTILVGANAAAAESETANTLAALLPRARIVTPQPEEGEPEAHDPEWNSAIAQALVSERP